MTKTQVSRYKKNFRSCMYIHVSHFLTIAVYRQRLSLPLSTHTISTQSDLAAYDILLEPAEKLDHSHATSPGLYRSHPFVHLCNGVFNQLAVISCLPTTSLPKARWMPIISRANLLPNNIKLPICLVAKTDLSFSM